MALSSELDLSALRKRVAEDALAAKLHGLGAAIELVAGATPEGTTVSIPVTTSLTKAPVVLEATVRPIKRGATLRTASYACFGAGGLFLLFALGFGRRRKLVVDDEL